METIFFDIRRYFEISLVKILRVDCINKIKHIVAMRGKL